MTCIVEVCDRKVYSKSLCRGHYERQRVGKPLGGKINGYGKSAAAKVRSNQEVVVELLQRLINDPNDETARLLLQLAIPDARMTAADVVSLIEDAKAGLRLVRAIRAMPDRSKDYERLMRQLQGSEPVTA